MAVLTLILPVFAVVVVGYLSVRLKVVPASIAPPLVQFMYHISLPALMFHVIAGDSLASLLNEKFWIALGGGSLLLVGIVFFVGRRWLGNDLGSRAVMAFVAVEGNAAFVALPVLHALFGAKGVAPAAIANIVMAALMFPILAALLELSRVDKNSEGSATLKVGRGVLLSPLVWPTLLGVVFSVFAIPVPQVIDSFLVILGSALTPCALFAVGASLDLNEIRHDSLRISLLSAIKLLVLPLLVFAIGYLLEMEPFYLVAVTVCAAVPSAKNVFILASEYRVAEKSVAAVISASTAASIVTITLSLMALELLYPSVFANVHQSSPAPTGP